jgi:CRISPR-associated protein Cas5h
LNLISFGLEGDFSAFRDPSVTTNQTVCTIPSKSALIGLIGAMIGIDRTNSIDELYCQEYLSLLRSTSIGIKMRSSPRKVTFFTNHRSFKEAKTKPFKTELLVSPSYTIFVSSEDEITEKLLNVLEKNAFKYCPTLGHAYCLARIPSYKKHVVKEVDPASRWVSSVILDETSETEKENMYDFLQDTSVALGRLMLERHLHHYFADTKLEKRVLRHWIPVPVDSNMSRFKLTLHPTPSLARFVEVDQLEDEAVCLY